MPYRVRSTDIWYNLPGVEVAYQMVLAPDSFAARQNVAHNGAKAGVYTANPNGAPIWSATRGWKFDAGNTCNLVSGLVLQRPCTIIVSAMQETADAGGLVRTGNYAGKGIALGTGTSLTTDDNRVVFLAQSKSWQTSTATVNVAGYVLALALAYGADNVSAPYNMYLDGVSVAAGDVAIYDTTETLLIGGGEDSRNAVFFAKSALVASRLLTSAEIWLACQQMTGAALNNDWSAWSRRRRYYYNYVPVPLVEAGSAQAALGGSFGAQLSKPPFGSHSGPRRPTGPLGGHRGKLNA